VCGRLKTGKIKDKLSDSNPVGSKKHKNFFEPFLLPTAN
jgi:hypothetical protein